MGFYSKELPAENISNIQMSILSLGIKYQRKRNTQHVYKF